MCVNDLWMLCFYVTGCILLSPRRITKSAYKVLYRIQSSSIEVFGNVMKEEGRIVFPKSL